MSVRVAQGSRWTLLGRGSRRRYVHVRCACGTEREITSDSLRCGSSRSCGCYCKERSSVVHRTHGASDTPEYGVWTGMRRRCTKPTDPAFPGYGGRGIAVCARWDDFATFLADVGPRPSPLHTIERKNNDGCYEPGNCVWATKKAQARNRRSSRRLTLNDETKTVAEWGETTGLGAHVIQQRLEHGWSIERALTVPRDNTKLAAWATRRAA